MTDFHVCEQIGEHIEDVLLIVVIELLSGLWEGVKERVKHSLSNNVKVDLEGHLVKSTWKNSSYCSPLYVSNNSW